MSEYEGLFGKRAKYKISKHRYLELKHFCLQYDEWVREISKPIFAPTRPIYGEIRASSDLSDKTAEEAVRRAEMSLYVRLLKDTASQADEAIGSYILEAVTKGYSYTYMKMNYEVPCEKDMYFDRYRKFFWLLDKKR